MVQQQFPNCFVRIYQDKFTLVVRLCFDESFFQSTSSVIRVEYYDDAARFCVTMIDRYNRKNSSIRLRLCGKHKEYALYDKRITDIKDVGVIMYLTFVDKNELKKDFKTREKKIAPRIKYVGFITDKNATVEEMAKCINSGCV
jgi:hypothetical protein